MCEVWKKVIISLRILLDSCILFIAILFRLVEDIVTGKSRITVLNANSVSLYY